MWALLPTDPNHSRGISHRDAGMPEGTEMKGCGSFSGEMSRVAEGARMGRTQTLEQWFSIGGDSALWGTFGNVERYF